MPGRETREKRQEMEAHRGREHRVIVREEKREREREREQQQSTERRETLEERRETHRRETQEKERRETRRGRGEGKWVLREAGRGRDSPHPPATQLRRNAGRLQCELEDWVSQGLDPPPDPWGRFSVQSHGSRTLAELRVCRWSRSSC